MNNLSVSFDDLVVYGCSLVKLASLNLPINLPICAKISIDDMYNCTSPFFWKTHKIFVVLLGHYLYENKNVNFNGLEQL